MQLQFRDSAINIRSDADGDLDINADDEIELNSTLIDVNGNLDVSGTIVGASTLTGVTQITVDDIDLNGKVITMTGSSGDTFVTTVAANGATSLVTTDAAAAAAHLTITADGTVDINSAGVLTLDSGAAINIEPAAGSAILLDGTISVDAGVVTGATSITSTAFVGGLTGNVTGNASGTALTVTQAAQSAITSVGTLTALAVDNITIDANTISTTNTNGALDLTPNGTGNINLNTDKVEIIAAEGESSTLTFITDEGDDNGDVWSFIHNTDNTFSISTNASGSNANHLILTGHATATSGSSRFLGGIQVDDNIVMGTAGKGIYLGVTSATASELLDDYEEGTWTPSISSTSGGSDMAYSGNNSGHYTKIGDFVYVHGMMQLTAKNNLQNGSVFLKGFPFNIASTTSEGPGGVITEYANIGTVTQPILAETTSERMLVRYTAADGGTSHTNLLGGGMADNSYIRFYAMYKA